MTDGEIRLYSTGAVSLQLPHTKRYEEVSDLLQGRYEETAPVEFSSGEVHQLKYLLQVKMLDLTSRLRAARKVNCLMQTLFVCKSYRTFDLGIRIRIPSRDASNV